jgi:leucyl-tRNA synthetase
MARYNPKEIENKWIEEWDKQQLYKTKKEEGKDKFYSLYSFPYPSGSGLHVGHAEGMVTNDIVARYKRMKGLNVLLPMGWDSFGLPAENYAIKTNVHPHESTEANVINFIDQIKKLGISVDWDLELGAHRHDYYKWTQWIFLQLYKKGLAYKKVAPVNWCPKDQTVLANEQVIDGKCERCDTEVIQKDMAQWFFKITDFAERLVKDLDKVDWPESTKTVQKHWIGKSVGSNIKFGVLNPDTYIEIFTTRIDTIFGCTFLVVAPENNVLNVLQPGITNWTEVEEYIRQARNKSDLERQSQKEKTGIKLEGINAINPFNNEEVPIFVADYVLNTYGTGAIMAVPAHDERDGEFAEKYNIEIKDVIEIENAVEDKVVTDYGTLINSGEYTGLSSIEATNKMQDWLEQEGFGSRKTTFRLRDWLVSRQRYWGCPIPIVYDPEGNEHALDEKDLPLLLPTDVDFKPTGESPIKGSESFKKLAEEKYGKGWYFEADTMDTFVDSSWYFLRFADQGNNDIIFTKENVNYWNPADLYMIGSEHTVLHLMYSRFFTKFLFDEGFLTFDEPFQKLRHMGTILGPDGRKMSKRWGNVINPNDEIARYSADTVRMYEMFMGPLEESKPWNDKSESGVFRFLSRVWDLADKVTEGHESAQQDAEINKLIQKIERDIDNLSFNTAVAKFMEFLNFASKEEKLSKDVFETYLKLLAPFAPYITEELWHNLGNTESIHLQSWPVADASKILSEDQNIAVQFNGKSRGVVTTAPGSTEDIVMDLVKAEPSLSKYITGDIKKVIFVPGRIINIIV